MKIICILFCSVLLIINSCTPINNSEGKLFETFKKVNEFEKGSIYIIPNSGCSGCITNAETKALNDNSDTALYLFTRISSIKQFRNRFDGNFIGRKNIIIDSNNYFEYPKTKLEIYPLEYYKTGNVIRLVGAFK